MYPSFHSLLVADFLQILHQANRDKKLKKSKGRIIVRDDGGLEWRVFKESGQGYSALLIFY